MLVLAAAFTPRITSGMRDFEVYHTAAGRAAAGAPLYRAEDEHYQFKYLPAFAVFARPLALLPLESAKIVWFFSSVLLLFFLIRGSLRLLPIRRRPAWLLVAVGAMAMGKFIGHELGLGQVNLLLAATVVAATLALRRGADALAGALLVVAVVVKPYAILFLPWIAAQQRWRAVAAASIGGVATLFAPVPAYGLDGALALHQAWWTTVTESTGPNLLNQDNVSVAAMFAKWLSPGALATTLAAVTSLALLTVAVLVIAFRRGVPAPEGLEAALLLTLLPLLSPQGWDYVFLVSTPAVILIANEHDRLPAWLRALSAVAIATVGLSLYDVLGRERYAAFMALSIISVCFLIVVGALAALRRRKDA
jgi:hypothetical protein